MNTTLARPPAVPEGRGNVRAIVLAVLVHALLGILLFFGIRWQSSEPAVIQAELWSATPETAAPPPQRIPPPPKVEAPTPEPKAEPEPPPPKADIVEKVPPKVEPKKKEPVKVEAPKPVVPPPLPKTEIKPKPEPKPEPVKLPPPKEAPVRPPSDLAAIMASANGTPTSTGKDQQTSGPRGRDSYFARLVTAIRSQMRYPASAPGNPFVTMRIEQLPNGEVVNVTMTKPSGVPAFDDAVERAIRAASPLPRDEQGKVERQLNLDYYMYEKN